MPRSRIHTLSLKEEREWLAECEAQFGSFDHFRVTQRHPSGLASMAAARLARVVEGSMLELQSSAAISRVARSIVSSACSIAAERASETSVGYPRACNRLDLCASVILPSSRGRPGSASSPHRNARFVRAYSSRPMNEPAKSANARKKVTLHTLKRMYRDGEPIVMVTAHDYPSGVFLERADVDVCLVGDSLAMVALGYDSTTKVSLDEMIQHSRAVARGCKTPFLIGDLPFGTYEVSPQQAVGSAIRMLREGNMEAVKLEGGKEMARTVEAVTAAGIPVLGHIGLTPQRTSQLGGFRVQGKTVEKAVELLEDAQALEAAGCFAVVIEAVPEPVATWITSRLSIPTIGIGAGSGTSGQVLVQNDMLGMFDRFSPKFCKHFANVSPIAIDAISTYRSEVKSRTFPASEHTYSMAAGEEGKLAEAIKQAELVAERTR